MNQNHSARRSALQEPFAPTANLSLERFGRTDDASAGRMELEVGGYLAVYVGVPGTGNIDQVVEAPEGAPTMHRSQAIGGAFIARDGTETLNLAVHALAVIESSGVLDQALRALDAAARSGHQLGARRT